MRASARWAIVAAGSALIALLPFLVGQLPAAQSSVSAETLLARIQRSADVGYSGYAEASGGLVLPVSSSQFNSLADLLGGTTDLRAWWRSPTDWRADDVNLTGEHDVDADSEGIWSWDYEQNEAIRTNFDTPPEVRLPRADDLLPPSLARRVLSQARPGEISRLPSQRIAGQDAAGLRLRPAESASTIGHVDVWAVPSSGLALRVVIYGRSGPPVVSTSMLDLSTATPPPSATAFTPPTDADVHGQQLPDIVAAVNQFGRVRPPATLAGLGRSPGYRQLGAVGVYGRGVTELVALPLPGRLADYLGSQLGASNSDAATALTIGPVDAYLTPRASNGSRWLLAGTVTAATLVTAGNQLPIADNGPR